MSQGILSCCTTVELTLKESSTPSIFESRASSKHWKKEFKGVFRRWQGGATDTASDIIVVVDLRNVMRTPAWTLPCLLAGRVCHFMGLGFHFKCPFQVGAQVPCCPSTRNLVTRMVREANLNLVKMQARQRQHPSLSGPDKTLVMGEKQKNSLKSHHTVARFFVPDVEVHDCVHLPRHPTGELQ